MISGRGFESHPLRHEPHRVRGSRAPYMVHGAMDYALHKVHGSPELNVVQGAIYHAPRRVHGSPELNVVQDAKLYKDAKRLALCTKRQEPERCPRGRRGSPAKRVSRLKRDRGFESLSLRQSTPRLRLASHLLDRRSSRGA